MSYKRKTDKTVFRDDNKINVEDLIIKLNQYIDDNTEPLIQEFALLYPVNRQYIYQLSDVLIDKGDKRLSDAIARAKDKRELFILRGASTRAYDPNFAQFILKQPAYGYKDKTDTNITVTPEENTLNSAINNLSEDELRSLISKKRSNNASG